MKKSLEEYKNTFNPILEDYIFSKKECERIVNTLVEQKHEWESRTKIMDRSLFLTYGAMTYLDKDDMEMYGYKANFYNTLLVDNFGWVFDKIKNYYKERLNKPITYTKKAMPGFHIFQDPDLINNNKWWSSIHIDMPYENHEWSGDIISVSSFTIAIQMPKCTSGLRFWSGDTMRFNKNDSSPSRGTSAFMKKATSKFYYEMDKLEQKTTKEGATYIPYKEGYIYEQSGHMFHQIAEGGDMEENEKRITIQGHITELEKEIVIYV